MTGYAPVANNRANLALGAESALLPGELDALEEAGEVCPFGIEHGGGAGEFEEPGALLASGPGGHGAATWSGHLHDRDGGAAAPDRLDASGEILGGDRGEPGLLVPAREEPPDGPLEVAAQPTIDRTRQIWMKCLIIEF